MGRMIRLYEHPIGVILDDTVKGRELVIEGEIRLGMNFEQLKQIARTTGKFEVSDPLPPWSDLSSGGRDSP
jgi:hypothetical protein